MSEENVELVRRLYDASERGDLTTVFSIFDEEVEWDMSRFDTTELTFKPLYRGHDGIREFWREWYFTWDRSTFPTTSSSTPETR
jgi:ketosteroid isomerase-like protein